MKNMLFLKREPNKRESAKLIPDVPFYVFHARTYVFERTPGNQGNDAFLCYQGTREANISY